MAFLITWGNVAFFSDFQYGFRSSPSSAVLLIVVSDRIARLFNRSGATWAVVLDISKAFNRVWHAGLLHKPRSWGISSQMFGLISSFLSSGWLRVVLDGKSSQEFPVGAGVPQGSFLVPHFSCCMVWYLCWWYYSLFWVWSGIWSVAAAWVGSWFRLTGLITIDLLMWKWMGLFYRENYLLRCWGWPSHLNLHYLYC